MIATVKPQVTDMTTVDALWVLIQGQTKAVRKALTQRLLDEEKDSGTQKKMLRNSLTQAFEELHSGQAKHNARRLFICQ